MEFDFVGGLVGKYEDDLNLYISYWCFQITFLRNWNKSISMQNVVWLSFHIDG